ncbi:hypothetical protein SAMN06265377_2128 [Flagellimonas pacifica]|uniref:Uncharacterized protein n=1 Tax=Flagellimonas pacifica TaxID=1247520 RepID=A0A285MT49_9FLAO|nr:hypothetical protein SAMN06265377_2128 [Allomuricauda parva]
MEFFNNRSVTIFSRLNALVVIIREIGYSVFDEFPESLFFLREKAIDAITKAVLKNKVIGIIIPIIMIKPI